MLITILASLTYSDINACDKHGRSALHLVASSESVHARKMVSLLMRSGSNVGEYWSCDLSCDLSCGRECSYSEMVSLLMRRGEHWSYDLSCDVVIS